MDQISPEHRSWNMSRIKGKNTKPELLVRSWLHRHGLRFRLHLKNMPGTPDNVLPKYGTVIEVRGCYWHRHPRCKFAYTPKSNVEFWNAKFAENIKRDISTDKILKESGWRVIVIWECEVKSQLDNKLKCLFSPKQQPEKYDFTECP